MTNKNKFLSEIFYMFEKNDIQYFVFGSYRSLPKDTGGSDVDVVILQEIEKADYVLRSILFKYDVSLVSYYTNENARFYRILDSKWGVQFDMFDKGFFYKGVEYYPLSILKESVIKYNDIWVLEEKKAFFVDYIKEIIHNGISKEKYRKAFCELMVYDRQQYEKELEKIYSKKVTDLIINNLTLDGLNKIGTELQVLIKKSILKGNGWKFIKAYLKTFRRIFNKAPGYVIVVEGTDGAGKSSIINGITPILNEGFHNSVIYNHLRPHVIPDLGVLLGKRSNYGPSIVNSTPHALEESGFFGSIIRWGYYMIDYTFGYIKVVWPQIHTKSKVFIFDRYYYDYYIDQKRSRISLPCWIIRMGEILVPKPDLIICLGGDPTKIYERKPETSLKEVVRQTEALKEFCSNRDNAVWVDTTCPLELSVNSAMRAIVDMMSKRFEKSYIK